MKYNNVNQINLDSKEGKLLMAAMAVITTESRKDQTPDEVLAHVESLSEKMFPVELKSAIDVLKAELKADCSEGSYYHSWQSNIAMAYLDAHKKVMPETGNNLPDHILAQIGNAAAGMFLNNLILSE